MSTTWWIGIVAKAPLEERGVQNFVKVLFDLCDDVGFTKLWRKFSYWKDRNIEFEFEFKENPSASELIKLISDYANKKGVTSFNITGGFKDEWGFDCDVEVQNMGELVDVWFRFDDYISEDPRNVAKILDICEAAYDALDAFYAYLSSEDDRGAAKELTQRSEFKRVKDYEAGKLSFNMKKFREEVVESDFISCFM